jgi:hypothetical protein
MWQLRRVLLAGTSAASIYVAAPGGGGGGDAILDTLQTETDGLVLDFENNRTLVRVATVDTASTPNSLLTYTSPSAKWIRTVAGVLETASTIRTDHDASNNPLGIRVEEARTNLCLYSDDFTNAAWTKSNMTTAYTSTGPDGVGNSATRLTASAGNATALQAITSGSADRITSCYIKRITGTGNIDLTQDNGSTWTTVTTTGSWTRVEIAAATAANPTVGIRIVTSGDAVDVAFFDHEVGSFTTSPIRTTSATVTRAADNIKLLNSAYPYNATVGYVLAAYRKRFTGAVNDATWSISDGTNGYRFVLRNDGTNPVFYIVDGYGLVAGIDAGTVVADTDHKAAAAWAANDVAISFDGGAAGTDTSATMPATTQMSIGSESGGAEFLNGHILYIKYVPRRVVDADLVTEST